MKITEPTRQLGALGSIKKFIYFKKKKRTKKRIEAGPTDSDQQTHMVFAQSGSSTALHYRG